MSTSRTAAQPPLETIPPRITAQSTSAGGYKAIVQSMKHTVGHMGVRRSLQLLNMNQPQGFDCPSCAWPEPKPDVRAKAEFCESGAKALASEGTRARADRAFFSKWSLAAMGTQSDYWMNEQGRLSEPMVLRNGATHYEPISWDDAFALIAKHLRAMESPNRASFYTSGRTSNEAAFVYQLLARQLGTNNLPDCSNMCHESTSFGMAEQVGIGKGTVLIEDFEKADAIFLVGQNPGTNHPRMLTTLREAKLRGCTIVAVNPLDEPGNRKFAHPQHPVDLVNGGVELATLHLAVRINGDLALFKGIMKVMLEREGQAPGTVLDWAFIQEHTDGFDAFAAALRAAPWDEIIEESGISRTEIDHAAQIMVDSKRTIICWAMGITQHKNGVANVYELVNCLLMKGNIGKEGAGACPIRGHSNVQGDRTMGIWEQMADTFLDALGKEFDFSPPRPHGHDAVGTVKAMLAGDIDVFFGMGGNFLAATPDTERVAVAMKRCKLTVQVQTKLNRGHVITGEEALILPCRGRSEIDEQAGGRQFVTVENSMSIISKSEGHLEPASPQLKSEVAIVCGLATKTLGADTTVDWQGLAADYDRIRTHIQNVVPGFDNYNERVRVPGGFYLGNSARDRKWATPSHKAHFHVTEIPHHDLGGGRLMMTTIRSHDQYNTTVYGLDDRYRGVYGARRVIFMNPQDATARGLVKGSFVDITSHALDGSLRQAERWMVVPYKMPRACVATYFPESNVLVPLEAQADKSGQPTSKSIIVSIKLSTDQARISP